ncbi:MAG: PAS domain-containing protein [Rhodospirillales bacterium]|nr:PAS domain-containing protein [Rhodospirillales bacterium]
MWETLLSEVGSVAREADIASAHGRRFFRHWRDLRGSADIPARQDFDPFDVPWILGDLSLIERVPDDYLFRVDGTRAVEFFGNEMTGRLLSQYPFAERVPQLRAAYDTVVESRAPHVWLREAVNSGKRRRIEQLLLPLAGADGAVSHIAISLDTFAPG